MSNFGTVPQFTYNGATTFIPTYAPIDKEPLGGHLKAERHDSITTSGLQQTVTERIDRVTTLNFPNVPQSDLASWDAFFAWAIQGQQFEYAPDSTVPSTFFTYIMTSMEVPYKRVNFQLFSITFEVRQVIAAQVGS